MTKLPNGYARRHHCRPSDFDARQLDRGTTVELEHTSDRKLAQQIALDHLCEDRDYYKKLAKIHLDGTNERSSARYLGIGAIVGATVGVVVGALLSRRVG